MKEELWLKKMKERLDDYSEPLPSDGWERLEKALQPSPVRMKRTIFFRRWTVAAAVALLLVVSSVGVWLLQSPVADEIRNTSMPALAVVPDELPEPAVQENLVDQMNLEPAVQENLVDRMNLEPAGQESLVD